MSSKIRYIFAFIFLFALFSEEIFFAYLSYRGITTEGGMLKRLFFAVFSLSFLVLLYDQKNKPIGFRPLRLIMSILVILCLYCLTSLWFGSENSGYMNSIFRFGIICIPCAIIGMNVAMFPCFHAIDRMLPLFVIPISLIIGSVGLRTAALAEITHEESGLTYQKLSYIMAEMYAYCAYYIFYSTVPTQPLFNKIMKILLFGVMIFSALVCAQGGGRGALVFMIVVTIIIVVSLYRIRVMDRLLLTLILAFAILAFLYLASKLNVWDSVGFQRVENNLNADNRYFWLVAWNTFLSSPLFGYGLGSVWYTVSIYSHNIFLDLLAETGILGTTIFLIYLKEIIQSLYYLFRKNKCVFLLVLVFTKSFILLLVSGYWIMSYQLFMVFGYVIVQNVLKKNQ